MFRVWSPWPSITVSLLADFTPSPNTRACFHRRLGYRREFCSGNQIQFLVSFQRRENRRSLASFDRKEIAPLEAIKSRDFSAWRKSKSPRNCRESCDFGALSCREHRMRYYLLWNFRGPLELSSADAKFWYR